MCYDIFISSKIYSLQNGIAQNRVVSFLFFNLKSRFLGFAPSYLPLGTERSNCVKVEDKFPLNNIPLHIGIASNVYSFDSVSANRL